MFQLYGALVQRPTTSDCHSEDHGSESRTLRHFGGVAQLVRALALQARGRKFESFNEHQFCRDVATSALYKSTNACCT